MPSTSSWAGANISLTSWGEINSAISTNPLLSISQVMTLNQKITRLQTLLEHAQEHEAKTAPNASFRVWKDHAVSTLSKVLRPDSPETVRVKELTFTYNRGLRIRGIDYSEVDRESRIRRYKHDFEVAVGIIRYCLNDFLMEQEEQGQSSPLPSSSHAPLLLAHLHPTVQQAAGSRFATAHHSDAILATCTALDKAVQAKAQRPDLNGKQLMDVVFTPNSPLVRLSQDRNEQTGFMLLYQGVMQAIRNHYAHNDSAIDPARALEWLGFISALFHKLDEGEVANLS